MKSLTTLLGLSIFLLGCQTGQTKQIEENNSDELIFVVDMSVNGKSKAEVAAFTEFYTAQVEENEPNSMGWGFFESGEKVILIERYKNADAMINHATNVSAGGILEEAFTQFNSFFTINMISIHGNISDELKETLSSFPFAVSYNEAYANYSRMISSMSSSPEVIDLETQRSEVNTFIDNQFNFFYESSLETAQNTFSSNAVLIGTDAAEYYSGWEAMKASIEGQLAIENPMFTHSNRNVIMSSSGDMASYTQLLNFLFEVDGESMSVENVRNSGVIQKINGEWKIVQIHWSIGVQGQAVTY